ncbi:MAG: flagellar biosynthetic protein FliR, partial [Planctomycetota bacterium]|nr:flagellar biosynthetic protein FliR [Planctomycetota bacterium]
MVEVDRLLLSFIIYALALIRCSGLVVFAPFFGAEHFPALTRIGMAAFFALVMFPAAAETAALPPRLDAVALGLLALQEISVGLLLGFLASLIFLGVQLAGELVSQQIGFSLANIVDPLYEQEIPLLGFFKINLAVAIFLLANLHLAIIGLLHHSFTVAGLGTLTAAAWESGALLQEAEYHAMRMMVVALQLAMPVILILLLEGVVEGFVTRTMPQMNILVLG